MSVKLAYIPQKNPLFGSEPDKVILQVADAWNASIPIKHVAIITDNRRILIQRAIMTYTIGTLLSIIAYYGKRPWNVKNKAWKPFDHFIAPDAVAYLFEEMEQLSSRKEARQPVSKEIAPMVQKIGKPVDPQARRQFDAMDTDSRRRLWNEAREYFVSHGVCNPASAAIMSRVLNSLPAT